MNCQRKLSNFYLSKKLDSENIIVKIALRHNLHWNNNKKERAREREKAKKNVKLKRKKSKFFNVNSMIFELDAATVFYKN